MSSAQNHMKRSHRSSMTQRGTFGTIHRKATYRNERVKYVKTVRQRLAEAIARLRKPKETKGDKKA